MTPAGGRVQFVSSHLREGGAQHLWFVLIRGLHERGHDVALLTLEDEGRYFHALRAAGVECRCAAMRRRTDVGGLRRALARPARPPRAVLSHGVRALAVGSRLARRDGVSHVALDYRAPGFAFKPHRELIVRLVAPRVDRVVATSPCQVPELVRRRYPAERISVIRAGIEELRPATGREEMRARLGLADGDVAALLVAVLRPEKRVHRFVDAVARAHAEEPRIRGLVAGEGPERPRVEAAARGAGGTVRLLGHREDVADLIQAADVVCLSSDVEIQPVCFLEAMALARPVLGTDVGCLAEVVVEGVTGHLVPPDDGAAYAAALVRLAREPERAAALGEAGRDRQRRLFRAERMLDEYAGLVDELDGR